MPTVRQRTRWMIGVIVLITLIWGAVSLKPSPYRTGDVSTFRFQSQALNDRRQMWIYLPPGYTTGTERYPLLILHDGQNVFDGNTSTHHGMEWRVDETLERMIRNRDIPPLVVVAVNSTDTRSDEYLPVRGIEHGREAGGHADRYADMLTDELLPYLHQTYRLKNGPENTFVGGSSYGGILSFYLAMNHADTFGAALVVSPSVQWNDRWMKRTVDDLFWKHNVKLWLDYGYNEGDTNTFLSTIDALEAKGWQRPYDMQVVVDGGFHIESAWARRFPMMMDWLFNEAVFVEEAL